MSQIKRHLEQLPDPADGASQEVLDSMGSALALEAIATFLQGAKATLGPTALRLANLAIEAHATAPALRDRGLAFSLEEAIADPDNGVQRGIEEVQAQIEAAWGGVDQALAKLMSAQVAKMASYKERSRKLREAADALSTKVQGLAVDLVPQSSYLTPSLQLYQLSHSEKGFTPCAADVPGVVTKLLSAHAAGFTKIVSEQVAWLKSHQADLTANKDVFRDLSFDGHEVLTGNATRINEVGTSPAVYFSNELPGGATVLIELPDGKVQGHSVIDALKLVDVNVSVLVQPLSDSKFNVLTVSELQGLAAQIQTLLPALGDWYGAIYSRMWQNEDYSAILCRAVMRGLEDTNPGTREFKNLAISVFRLMHVATKAIDEYVFSRLEALVAYGEASLAQYPVN
mgnify:CR=1 FL=1